MCERTIKFPFGNFCLDGSGLVFTKNSGKVDDVENAVFAAAHGRVNECFGGVIASLTTTHVCGNTSYGASYGVADLIGAREET